MLEAEKNNLHLLSRVHHLRDENRRLKRLLEENGIEYRQDGECRSDRTSASSNDTTTISNVEDQHEMPTHPELDEPNFETEEEEETPGPLLHPTPPTNYD